MTLSRRAFARALSATLLICAALATEAATLSVDIVGADDKPLADAVVYAMPKNGKVPAAEANIYVIDQINRQFVPIASIVRTGTEISFPNRDNIRHNVYSFSPPKTFELRLYSGVPSKHVAFDKPGLVVLGCNIHDQMVAYVRVVDTPWFGKSDAAGKATVDLPIGDYEVRAWHYRLADQNNEASRSLKIDAATSVRLKLETRP